MQPRSQPKINRTLGVTDNIGKLTAPCGCQPTIEPCECQDHACVCPIELEWVNMVTGAVCDCEWSEEETYAFRKTLAKVLAQICPHHANRAKAEAPILSLSKKVRIETMRRRYSQGCHIYHPDDINTELYREGSLAQRGPNGCARTVGVGSVQSPKHEARWAKKPREPRRLRVSID